MEIRIFRLRQEKHIWFYAQKYPKATKPYFPNNDEHTHTDRANGSTDLLDMWFISPSLAKHDIQFQIGNDLGSDHLPIEISIGAPPHRNLSANHTKYKFDQTDREVFESTLGAALGSEDFSGLTSSSDLDKYADFIVSAISTAVDRAIPKSKSVRTESNPISEETLALIKRNVGLGDNTLRLKTRLYRHTLISCRNKLRRILG